jgi:hypothetical protein
MDEQPVTLGEASARAPTLTHEEIRDENKPQIQQEGREPGGGAISGCRDG